MAGVIVEGVDGAGKTTLIRYLRDHTFWPVCHVVQPYEPNVPQMLELAACAPVIFDRFHLSPVVYGEVLREGPELDRYDLWGIEGFLKGRGYELIWCDTSVNTMVNNNRKEEQLWELTREGEVVAKLSSAYAKTFSRSELSKHFYNYEAQHPGSTLGLATTELPLGIQGTGYPTIWIVGDEKQQTREGVMEYLPFYTPHVGDQLLSGTLLQRSMDKLGWDWRWVAMSNSAINGAVVPLREWYNLLEPSIVISLGGEAAERLDRAEIPNHRVAHPQYRRRFSHRTCEMSYPEELQDAARTRLA